MSGLLRGGGGGAPHGRARGVSFTRGLRLPKVVNERCLLALQRAGWVPEDFWGSRGVRQKVFVVNRLSAQGVDL